MLRLFPVSLLLSGLVGCGGAQYRMQVIGTGAGVVAPRGTDVAGAAGPAIHLAAGIYKVNLRFDLPRAQLVEWTISCPEASVAVSGQVGESLDDYRRRRAAELHRDQEQVAGVASSVIGLVAPPVRVEAHAAAPGTAVDGTALVVPGAVVGSAVADAAIDPIVPAWDVGAGQRVATADVQLAAPSACSLVAIADDATVGAAYQITQIIDVRAEHREATRVAEGGAIELRTRLHAQLIAMGADEHARAARLQAVADARAIRLQAEVDARAVAQVEIDRQHQVAARDHEHHVALQLELDGQAQTARAEHDREVQVRVEHERQVRWEREAPLRARAGLELSWVTTAQQTRASWIVLLVGWGANPHRREQLIAEREGHIRSEQARRDAALQLAMQQRDLQARAAAQLEQGQLQAALQIRVRLHAHLVALGAVERPPMPALLAESSGGAPFDGAVWTAGQWQWVNLEWRWTAGSWADSIAFGDAGSVDNGPRPTAVVTAGPGSATVTTVTTNQVDIDGSGPALPPAASSGVVSGGISVQLPVGIHVGGSASGPAPAAAPRDHRQPAPRQRDHRH